MAHRRFLVRFVSSPVEPKACLSGASTGRSGSVRVLLDVYPCGWFGPLTLASDGVSHREVNRQRDNLSESARTSG